MLPRPGFGNDPGFPHTFGKQRLTNHLVGFMRTPMHQILPLEKNSGITPAGTSQR